MKETGIPYSPQMVRARRAGIKTQTRRIARGVITVHARTGEALAALDSCGPRVRCPYGQPGDRLYVKEAWRAPPAFDDLAPRDIKPGTPLHYEADGERRLWGRYRHARFMPRALSRGLDEIVAIRVERLQDISEADAKAEGVERSGDCNWRDYLDHPHNDFTSARRSYRSLWESINGAGSWDANPWVWVITFKPVTL